MAAGPKKSPQPARLEPRRSLIGPVQSCVTDRKPADWGRRYLRMAALIKASRRRFVNSRRSGSPRQRPSPAGLNYRPARISLIYSFLLLFRLELGSGVAGSSPPCTSTCPLLLPTDSASPSPPPQSSKCQFLHLIFFPSLSYDLTIPLLLPLYSLISLSVLLFTRILPSSTSPTHSPLLRHPPHTPKNSLPI